MERKEALKEAINYLKSTGGDNWNSKDELSRRTESMGFMSTAHAIADIYQRGVNPKDIDLQKIDFSLSQSEVRQQISELLDKRGASKFEEEEQRTIASDMERIEKLQEKEKERMQRTKEKIKEQIDEIKDGGKLFEARQKAWDGYKLSNLESEGMFKSLIRAIEFAEAILEIDEKIEEDFEGDFEVLKDRKEQMQELVNRIEQLNFEASEIDQSISGDNEDKEQYEGEDVIEGTLDKIKELGNVEAGTEPDAVDTEFLIEEVVGNNPYTEEETETALETLKTRGVIYEPAPNQVKYL